MRLILFICISLLANMFHAAAMPFNNVSHAPAAHVVKGAVQHMDMQHAHAHATKDELKLKNHCPDNGTSCCFGVALQPFAAFPVVTFDSQERLTSLSAHLIKHVPLAPFRPPKFYLTLTA